MQPVILTEPQTEIIVDEQGNTFALVAGFAAGRLNNLIDVNVPNPVQLDFLVWDSTQFNWINASAGDLGLASQSGLNIVAGALTDHINNSSNPHSTTALQVGALPLAGGTMTGAIVTPVGTPALSAPGQFDMEFTPVGVANDIAFNVTFPNTNLIGIDNFKLFSFKDSLNRGLEINTNFPDFFSSTAIQFDASSFNASVFSGMRFITGGTLGVVSFQAPGAAEYVGFNPGANSVISSLNTLNVAGQGGGTTLATFQIAGLNINGRTLSTSGTGLLLADSSGEVASFANTGMDIVGGNIQSTPTLPLAFWGATPIVQPLNIPNTTGAALAALETEVNNLKQLLRNTGLMAAI